MGAEVGSPPDPPLGLLGRFLARVPSTGAFRSLRHRAYFVLWSTHLVTQLGFWVSNVSMQWLVARRSDGDSLMLGLLFFFNLCPVLLFAPFAGVLADRMERRRIVAWGQALTGALAIGLVGALTATPSDSETAVVFGFAFAIGTVQAISAPAHQAVMVNAVPSTDMPSAVGLQAVALNLSRVAGPALATPILVGWGARAAFAVFAGTSLVTAYLLARLRVRTVALLEPSASSLAQFFDGFRIASARPPALLALSMVAVAALFSSSYVSQLPVFAFRVLDGDDGTFTALLVLTGFGAAAGALLTSSRRSLPSIARIGTQMVAMCLTLVLFSFSRSTALSLVLTAVIACLNFSVMTNLQTTLQLVAPEEGRGRLMAIFLVAWAGLLPIGALALGWVGSLVGPAPALAGFATVALAFAVVIVMRGPRVAPEPTQE